MNRSFPLLLLAALLSGCSTITAPSDAVARIPIAAEPTKGMRIENTALLVVDGKLVVDGRVRRIYRWYPVGNYHIDVEFRDAQQRQLALKSSRLLFQRTRFGPPPPAHFATAVDQWPDGTAEILVRTHTGYKHQ